MISAGKVIKTVVLVHLKQRNRLYTNMLPFASQHYYLFAWYYLGLGPSCYVAQNAQFSLQIFHEFKARDDKEADKQGNMRKKCCKAA